MQISNKFLVFCFVLRFVYATYLVKTFQSENDFRAQNEQIQKWHVHRTSLQQMVNHSSLNEAISFFLN